MAKTTLMRRKISKKTSINTNLTITSKNTKINKKTKSKNQVLTKKYCGINYSKYLSSFKSSLKKILTNENKAEVIKFIQENGMEIVYLGDIINIYKNIIGTPINNILVLSIYKTINIIIYLYSNVGMSWLEYFYMFPEGRDMFWDMIHDIPRLSIFITSFALLPKQTQSDWVITSILELFKNIGIIPLAYSTPKKYFWITNNELAIGIIQSIFATLYRKSLNKVLINEVKKYNDSILFHIKLIKESNLQKCKKDDLLTIYNLLENLKSKNSQISIYKFRTSIKNKNFDNALTIGKKILKEHIEDKQVIKKYIFKKQNGGRLLHL